MAKVSAQIQAYGMLPRGERVLAAVSGGADSVALLRLLVDLAPSLGYQLSAVHYEHGIRGEASRADARFVQALCDKLGLQCSVAHGDVPALRKQWRCSMEDAARRARYAFFEQVMREQGASRVVLAHHQRDQAETLVLHLVHGAGMRGLGGMQPVQGRYVRPLLDTPPEQLRTYLLELGQDWREDATNDDLSQPRALIRHSVLPTLAQINPAVVKTLCRDSAVIRQEDAYLDSLASQALAGRTQDMPYGGFVTWPQATPPALAARMLRGLPAQWGLPALEYAQTQRLVALLALSRGKENLGAGWHAEWTGRNLHFLMPNPPDTPHYPVMAKGETHWNDCLRVSATDQYTAWGDGLRTQVVPEALLEGCIWRTRRQGDRIHPFGAPGSRLLSDYLTDRKVERPFRDWIPLLAQGNEILWAAGVGASERLRSGDSAGIALTWHGELPWLNGDD